MAAKKTGLAWINSKEKRRRDLFRLGIRAPVYAVLFAACAVALKAEIWLGAENAVPRSLIQKQQRVGKDGKTFTLYKFRTLPEDTKEGPRGEGEPPPYTRVGRLMSRYSLDELPQLYNVLKGDMTYSSPRPLYQADHDLMKNKKYPDGTPVFTAEEIALWEMAHTAGPMGIFGNHFPNCRKFKDGTPEYLRARFSDDVYYLLNASKELDRDIAKRTGKYLRETAKQDLRDWAHNLRTRRQRKKSGQM